MHNRVWVKINKKNYPFICTGTEFLCSRNKTSYEENRLKFIENQKKGFDFIQSDVLHNKIFKFLGCYFRKHNFFYFKEYGSRFSAAHELQSTALDPDCGLFIGYQMPAYKHEGLNACSRLLRKNMNKFAELSFRSAHPKNHTSNTEYYERLHLASCFHYQRLAIPLRNSVPRTVCVMHKRFLTG